MIEKRVEWYKFSKNGKVVTAGVCPFTDHVTLVSNDQMNPITLISSIYLDEKNNDCQNKEYCWNFGCRYNRTSMISMSRNLFSSTPLTKEQFDKISDLARELQFQYLTFGVKE